MKWKAEPKKKFGSAVRTKFLWFPKLINNEWRWLEIASYEIDMWNVPVLFDRKVVCVDRRWMN